MRGDLETDLATLQAYIDGAGVKGAAVLLGMSVQGVKQRLEAARKRHGAVTTAQLILRFAPRLKLPD